MIKKYVIFNLIKQGYYDKYSEQFKGFLFSTIYKSKELALEEIKKIKTEDPLEIKEIYYENL